MSPTCTAAEPETLLEEEPVELHEPELNPMPELEPEPQPVGWKNRVRGLLAAIFEGHEEYLGWTPD